MDVLGDRLLGELVQLGPRERQWLVDLSVDAEVPAGEVRRVESDVARVQHRQSESDASTATGNEPNGTAATTATTTTVKQCAMRSDA